MITIVRIISRPIKNVYGVLSCTYRRGDLEEGDGESGPIHGKGPKGSH